MTTKKAKAAPKAQRRGPDPKPETNLVKAAGIPVHCAHSTVIDIIRVTPNPRNPNTHPPEQLDLLGRIIKANGWRSPITVSTRSGFVVKGHGRLLAAQAMGLSEVPVDYQSYDSDALEWSDLIADNKLKTYSEFDGAALSQLIQEMNANGADLVITALRPDELAPLLGADWTPPIPDDTEFERHPDQDGALVVKLTPEQRAIFEQACAKLKRDLKDDMGPTPSEGRMLELICGDYLSG